MRPAALLLVLAAAALGVVAPARAAGPVGEVVATCEGVQGWALDPDDPGAAIDVHLYFDGPAGDMGATGIPLRADRSLPGCRGDACGHGFTAALPLGRLDGQAHPVHAYGIDLEGVDPNLELTGSPASYACPPLPIVAGVRRHVLSPPLLEAWRFSIFWDLMKVADLDLAAAPVGPAIDAGPALVVADGDPMIWLVDQGARRPMDAASLAAWRLTPADAAPIDAASLAALPAGAPLPARPILVQGTGPAVFLLDDPLCLAGDPDPACPEAEGTTGGEGSEGESESESAGTGDATTGAPATTGEPASTSDGPSTGEPATDGATTATDGATSTTGGSLDAAPGDDGCACRAGGAPGGASAPLVLALVAARRRRRAAA